MQPLRKQEMWSQQSPKKKRLILNLSLDVSAVSFEEGFSRAVMNIGRLGWGKVEFCL